MTDNQISQGQYSFMTESIDFEVVETKSGKKYFVTGYISTPEMDLVNDIVTDNCLKSMLNQLKSRTITLDYDHEVFRENPTRIPVGKIVDARIDTKGLWVKAEMNSNSPKFPAMWGSLKDGFITAFSIAFKAIKTAQKTVGNMTARLLEDVHVINVALTGAPVNPGATIDGYGFKSVALKSLSDIEKEEVNLMSEAELKSLTEAKASLEAELKSLKESKEAEVKSLTEKTVVLEAEVKSLKEAHDKIVADHKVSDEKAQVDMKSLTEKNAALEDEMKKLKDASVFKSKPADQLPAQKSQPENKDLLGMIR